MSGKMEGSNYKVSGVYALSEEEKNELLRTTTAVPFTKNDPQLEINHRERPATATVISHHRADGTMIINAPDVQSNFNIYLATCSVNLAAISAGCVLTWSSPMKQKLVTMPDESFKLTEEEFSWLSSLMALGASCGPFVASAVVNKIGRKWTILFSMVLFLLSWTMLAVCRVIYIMYAARVVAGVAVGGVFTILPMYIAEIAPPDLRGMLGSLMQFFLCVGFLLSYAVGPYTSYLTLILISATMPLLCVLTFMWMPETPHFLVSKERNQEAFSSLEWLRGYPDKVILQGEIGQTQASLNASKRKHGSIRALFSSFTNIKALYYSCALALFQQMSGINVVLMYAETIFRGTGSNVDASISTIIVGVVMASAAGVTAPIAKIVGVKNLLCISAVGETMSMGALGYYFYLKEKGDNVDVIGWLPIASLVFFIITYSIGFGPFVWVIMAEIFPPQLKAIASALTASFCWVLCFILTLYFNKLVVIMGTPAVFWVFAGFCFAALLFVVFQLPDTEGKSFQEIQDMLHNKRPAPPAANVPKA